MNTERYYDIITSAMENYGLTRREATLIVTGFCAMVRHTESPHIDRRVEAKVKGILVGMHAAERLDDYQYEKLLSTVDTLDTNIRGSEEGYVIIENTLAHSALGD